MESNMRRQFRFLVAAAALCVCVPASAATFGKVVSVGGEASDVALDDKALVVTSKEFLLFDPSSGGMQSLTTIPALVQNTIPQPAQSFPADIDAASVAVSADGKWIYGFGGNAATVVTFRYDTINR